jgi:hypothetical protein
MADAESTPVFAQHWANQLGASLNSLERLQGGINNRVFRCSSGKQKWVIKEYAPAQPGQPDRMQAEVQFLRFASQVAPGFTPALIQADPDRRCVVLENLEGNAFPEGVAPPVTAIAAAVRFIHQLNQNPQLARESIQLDAAEGFLSLRLHLANVHGRLAAMGCQHLESNTRREAEQLLKRIRTELAQLEARTSYLIDQGVISDAIHPNQRCVSPSDFGFHNAISTAVGVRFIDFEFAGWDDPAKATLDFSLQPRIPLSNNGYPLLAAWHPEQQKAIEVRCQHLGPILRLKWLCIMLAVLKPSRLEQILAVMPGEEATLLIRNRLEKASLYLNRN